MLRWPLDLPFLTQVRKGTSGGACFSWLQATHRLNHGRWFSESPLAKRDLLVLITTFIITPDCVHYFEAVESSNKKKDPHIDWGLWEMAHFLKLNWQMKCWQPSWLYSFFFLSSFVQYFTFFVKIYTFFLLYFLLSHILLLFWIPKLKTRQWRLPIAISRSSDKLIHLNWPNWDPSTRLSQSPLLVYQPLRSTTLTL